MQLLVALYVIALDQFLKWLLVDSALHNTGIGWGLFGGNPTYTTLFVAVVSAIVIIAIARAWRQLGTVQRLGAMLLLAGLSSNLIDRVRVGGVIDPLSVGEWFPNFNLADCAIVVGLAVIVAATRSLDSRGDRHRLECSR